MKIRIEGGSHSLEERLRERLNLAAGLRCDEHGRAVESVIIHGRENGWFDSRWTTCCQQLEQKAREVVRERC